MMRIASVLGLALLSACSDGGGSSTPMPTPTPAPVNTAPTFTSGTTASVFENVALAYQAAATDTQPVSYAISGGADAMRFTITVGGTLSFVNAPNFESTDDIDGNNVYQVQISASDGSLSSTLALQITVVDSREGIAVKRVGTGFNQPIDVAAVPGDNSRVLVAERNGAVYFLTPATGVKTLALTVPGVVLAGRERGLISIVASPDYATSHEVMTYSTAADNSIHIHQCSTTTATCIDAFSVPHPDYNGPNIDGYEQNFGGLIAWGPDGNLYLGTGDGGFVRNISGAAANPNNQLGKILRLARNPNPFAGATPQYFMPAPGNPYLGGGGNPYIFAIGLENPFRGSFDGDRLLLGDTGGPEQINMRRIDQPGANFGWPDDFLLIPPVPPNMIAPVTQYPGGTGPKQGDQVVAGYVYRGPVASLVGQYVFGDRGNGNIWTVPATSLVEGKKFPAPNYEYRNPDFTPDVGRIDSLISFGVDSAGNLFLVDGTGEIFMVVAG